MLRLTTVDDLATTLGTVVREQSMSSVDGVLDDSAQIHGLHAQDVELVNLLAGDQLVLRACQVGRLLLDHCAAGSLLLIECRIDRLEIRNASSVRTIALADCELRSAVLHGVGPTRLTRISVASRAVVSGLRAGLDLRMVTAGELLVAGQLAASPDQLTVTVADSTVLSDLTVRDLEVANLRLRDCRVSGVLTLHRATVTDELMLEKVRCAGRLVLDGVRSGTPILVRGCALADGVDAVRLAQTGNRPPAARADLVAARFESTTVAGPLSVAVRTGPDRIVLADTGVTGQLRFPPGSACFRLVGSTTVADVELTARPIRGTRAAEALVAERFGTAGVVELGTVRSALSLRRRSTEEDLFYYLQRRAEAQATPGPRGWWARAVLGGVLGWGVRLRAPLRALLLGIAGTAAAVHLVGVLRPPGESLWSAPAVGRSVEVAAALWLNVGTGLPNDLDGGGWTAVSDVSAAGGLLLLTVLVGVAIRKLVR